MPLVNRDKDVSEQKEVLQSALGVIGTATTLSIVQVPYPSTLREIHVQANGLSGAPFWNFEIHRFIAGTGFTAMSVGSTTTLTAYQTSGIQNISLLASGNSLLNLIAGDCVSVRTGAANTAIGSGVVSVVIQTIQDVKAQYGSST